jgi:hypothetical protein
LVTHHIVLFALASELRNDCVYIHSDAVSVTFRCQYAGSELASKVGLLPRVFHIIKKVKVILFQ